MRDIPFEEQLRLYDVAVRRQVGRGDVGAVENLVDFRERLVSEECRSTYGAISELRNYLAEDSLSPEDREEFENQLVLAIHRGTEVNMIYGNHRKFADDVLTVVRAIRNTSEAA